jgi:hypothetical protein
MKTMTLMTRASFAVTAAGYLTHFAVPAELPIQGRGLSAGVGNPTLRRARVDARPHDSAMEATPV